MWIKYKLTIFVLIILAGQVQYTFGCLVPSYNRNKTKAYCSYKQRCPPDATHCHLGTCCLGCGRGTFEPRSSCKTKSDCKSSDRTKRYVCKKPGFNTKRNIPGVCCESKGY
ncbi:uncharacterized protein LOC123558723 [Mercenaria mercenaria]|uniref:uncharacterized protein LOC123558723 n=1 Tax=Mercenaria mercenaria TaxID=6596 RepID=UPI00234EBF05|nr:uncharacterized protein LOC123558723 [Mercenaria mercenaria]